jgi:alkylated DNA repair dioxygenase AlkB
MDVPTPPPVPGLALLPGYLDEAAQAALVSRIDQEPWRSDLKRRVQHYGYRYDYKARRADASLYIGPLPDWLAPLAARLTGDGLFAATPDQAIVNEYEPGQGIGRHIDCVPCFGPVVASLTLGSSCVMELFPPEDAAPAGVVPLLLTRGSLVVLSGEARYRWLHRIPARRRDEHGGAVIARSRRLSVTFRTVLVSRAQAAPR